MTCRRTVTAREEAAGVVLQGRFFVIGGRLKDAVPDLRAAAAEDEGSGDESGGDGSDDERR